MDVAASAAPRPVPEFELVALRQRLLATRGVEDPWDGQDARGLGPQALQHLLERWSGGYDWRADESRILALPWQVVGGGASTLRVVHRRAASHDAPVVVLLHGWPDSVLRFERLLPLLPDLNVVVPALPGFPFSTPHDGPASVSHAADLVAQALETLGYRRYVLSGGDVGGDVAEVLADRHPDRVAALHLTGVSARHLFAVDPADLDPDGRAYLDRAMQWNRLNGGYVAEQSSRPRTLLTGLGDSPAGLAAWVLEKVLAWTEDPGGSFSDDELLAWVSAYWFTGTIGSSFSTYAEPAAVPRRTSVPTVLSAFAHDIKPAPRSYAAAFVDLRAFVEHDAGGHFAAWEQPHAYAADLRRAVALDPDWHPSPRHERQA